MHVTVLASEVPAIKATALVNACQYFIQSDATESEEGKNESDLHKNMCLAYLQGYFAASDDIVASESVPSSFTLRAFRTRGMRLSERQEDLLERRYCVSKKESLQDFAEKVGLLDAEFSDEASAELAVEMVLEQHYLCQR